MRQAFACLPWHLIRDISRRHIRLPENESTMSRPRNETLARISTDGTALELDAFGRTLSVPVSEVAQRFIGKIKEWGEADELDMDIAHQEAFSSLTIEEGTSAIRCRDWMFPDERRKGDGYPRAAAQDRWWKWQWNLVRTQPAARQAVVQWIKAQGHEKLGVRPADKGHYIYLLPQQS